MERSISQHEVSAVSVLNFPLVRLYISVSVWIVFGDQQW